MSTGKTDMDSPLILAADLGTTRIKAGLFDALGEPVGAFAEVPQIVRHDGEGASEIDPIELRRGFLEALGALFSRFASDSRPVAAVAVSSFWHGLLGIGEDGRPATPIYTWADSRCRAQAAELRSTLDERDVHRRTGCMLRSSFWPAKLLWLRATSPAAFASKPRWVSPPDWLRAEFCGRVAGGIGMASGTGLLGADSLEWDGRMLEAARVAPESLAPLDEDPLPVDDRLARDHPRLRGAVWFPAIGDGAAGNLGSGADSERAAALNLGTSSALRLLKRSGPARAPFGLFCYRLDRDAFLVGGASSNSGNLRQWCLRELRLQDGDPALEAAFADRRRPSHGLTALPSWVAERAPDWDEEASGTISGLRMSTSALDILQALREASDYRLAEILDHLRRAEGASFRIVASGGAAASRVRLQALADALGEPVWPSAEREASLRGAAVHASLKLGHRPRPARIGEPIQPDPELAALHARLRRRQQALKDALSGLRR